ncbi:MAG: cbb3-type cytochrome oxidase assembly protein CcoS [Xanthobacteraceae bacterium]
MRRCSLRSSQYDDLDGAAVRILPDDDLESETRAIRIRQVARSPVGRRL